MQTISTTDSVKLSTNLSKWKLFLRLTKQNILTKKNIFKNKITWLLIFKIQLIIMSWLSKYKILILMLYFFWIKCLRTKRDRRESLLRRRVRNILRSIRQKSNNLKIVRSRQVLFYKFWNFIEIIESTSRNSRQIHKIFDHLEKLFNIYDAGIYYKFPFLNLKFFFMFFNFFNFFNISLFFLQTNE